MSEISHNIEKLYKLRLKIMASIFHIMATIFAVAGILLLVGLTFGCKVALYLLSGWLFYAGFSYLCKLRKK